ncbi:MAG: hypothetical protein OXJ52_08235 [Oligoflexia bacterium]|nr:hypothetical protein [Oligoflexia bacterium]
MTKLKDWGSLVIALLAFLGIIHWILTPIKEDISEIKNNHLTHIEERLNNLEKGQVRLETNLEYIKKDISEIKDIVSKQ